MNIELTRDNLDYIGFVARKYCNLCEPGWEEHVVENAWDLFERRIGKIDCTSNYNLYESSETIQTKIKRYGLASDKFWLLLLFLKDYTESCFGEYYIFDDESMDDNLKKMMNILDSWDCEMTISNKSESAHVNVVFIREELKELLSTLPKRTPTNSYPCIGKGEDNVLWHKVKFFMEMLDYFLDSLSYYKEKTKGRKDWAFTAQILYLVGYLEEKKYLVGYEETERIRKDIDGKSSVVTERTPVKNIGKYIKDNTKCCKAIPDRDKSFYCYNPYLDMID